VAAFSPPLGVDEVIRENIGVRAGEAEPLNPLDSIVAISRRGGAP